MQQPRDPVKLKCRTCGFDGNPSDAKRCMVCDERLGKKASAWDFITSPLGIFGALGLVSLGIFGWSSFSSLGTNADQPAAMLGTPQGAVNAAVSPLETPQVAASPPATAPGTPQLTVSGNDWAGFFLFRQAADPTSVFGKILTKNGLSVQFKDEPDFAVLGKKLAEGTYDIGSSTVDAVLKNPAGSKVAAMVDVSVGGDAVALRKGMNSLDDIKPGMKVAYASATPSETLLRTLALRFEAVDLKRLTAVEVATADEAWAQLKEGKVDMAVLWQPFTSLARREGLTIPLTSADAKNVILDVMLISQKTNPALAQKFVASYCQALEYYINRPDELRQAIGADSQVTGQELAELSKGISFVPCAESDRVWFAGGLFNKRQAVIAEIIGADGKKNLVDSEPLMTFTREEERRRQKIAALDPSLVAPPTSKSESPPQFMPLPGKEATNRPVIGSLRAGKVQFLTNSARLTPQGAQVLERFRATLDDFPSLRVLIAGHTSSTGDPKLNQLISQDRSIAVVKYFVEKGYPRERFSAVGYGASKPLPKLSTRSSANQRTEFKLIR
jgi:OmpA-OmpF porin, OOP family